MIKSITQKTTTKQAHNLNNYLLSCANQTKYLTCLFILLFSSMGWGQNLATIGSGTNETTSNGSDPIWGYWGSFRYQVVYTAAELTSAGMASGASISALGFSISGDYGGGNLLGYTIKMGHTSATNSVAHDASTTSTVKNAFSYNPSVTAAGAFDMITLDASFVWNGTSNILIDICSSGPNPYNTPLGKVRTIASSTTNGSRSIGNDGVGSLCGTTTSSTNSTKPQIRFAWVSASPCSGTPTPGNTIASVNPVGSGSSTVLSLQNATSGSGVTYQWQSSADNSTWNNVASNGTSASYSASPTTATYYRCNVTCSGNTGTSTATQVTLAHCIPAAATSTSTYFSNFVTTGGSTNISNNTNAFATNGYGNYYATLSASQFATGSLGFSATIVGGTAGIAIFVDWNNDLDFADAGETMYTSNAYMETGTTTSSFTIPAGTSIGDYRMRIVTDFNSTNPASCAFASGGRGEMEDYKLSVIAAPSCLAPTALTSSNLTTTSATISWTAASPAPTSGYQYYVSTSATAPTAGTTPTASTAAGVTTADLTGLTANTTYFFWVRSNCGGSDRSTWAGSGSFTTLCNAASVPWNEGFETGYTNNTAVGGCWIQSSVTGTQVWTANSTATDYNRTPRTGSFNAFLQWSNEDWLFYPVQLTGGTNYTFEVLARQDGGTSTNSNITLAYGTSASSGSMTTITGPTGIINGNYQSINGTFTPVSSGVYYMGIKGFMNGTPYYISLDDISLTVTPSCLAPTALTSSVTSTTAATLSWTAASPAPGSGYEIYYSTSSTAPVAGTAATTTTGAGVVTKNITGLTANTTYFFWVRSNCGGADGTSTWAGSGSFFTGYCVPTPTSVDGTGITNVTFGVGPSVNNTTGAEAGNYGNYTAQIGAGQQGVPLSVNVTFSTDSYTYDTKIWVDWNNNLSFLDAGEEMYVGTSAATNPAVLVTSFTIPLTTPLGNYRMRIGGLDTGPATPCYTDTFGSFEDYTLQVLADTSVRSVASGDWNSSSTWNTSVVPTCSDNVVIMTSHTVTVNSAGNVSSNLTVNSGGTLVVASGDLTVGCTLNNTPLTNNGTLTVSGGTLNVNGNLSSGSSSVFNQSGGNINIDGNNGGSSTGSVASGTPLLNLLQLNSGINWTGGTLTIVDPHTATTDTNGYAVFYSNATAGTNYPSANHTIQFGNGVSTDAGGHTSGFFINHWEATAALPFGSCETNGPSGTNRLVTFAYSPQVINGNLTVNSGGNIILGAFFTLGQNLTVNNGGTLINSGTTQLAIATSNTDTTFTYATSTSSQTIGGSGNFQNSATSPTANVASLTVNNSNATGVTLNVPLSISGTLTMTAGKINTTATNLLTLGTTTAAGTLSYTAGQIVGPFARTFATSSSTTAAYDATTLFPVGDGTNYTPIHIDPVNGAGPVVMRGQAFNTNSGSAGIGMASPLSNDRWEALATSGSSNLTSCFVGLNDAQIATGNVIAQSASAAGFYNAIAPVSTVAAGASIRTATAIPAASYTGFFTYGSPSVANTWTGTASNLWSTAGNWSLSSVPSATDDVLISSIGSNAPVMDVDVTIPAGKSLTLTGGTLTVASGKVLTIAGTANFGGMPVTFKSDATATAMLGPLTTGTLTGATNVTVERYIPARRAYRFLTSAVTTSTSIKANWQENVSNTTTVYADNLNPNSGYGTHITGTGGATNGFDTTTTNNPSMYAYTNGAWAALQNTNSNFTAGTPYRLLVRGDRSINMSTNSPTATPTTLRATGTLKTGNFTPALNQAASGYSFVGNPYQAPVDIKAALDASTNMDKTKVYYWDPTLNTRGAYVTRTLSSNSNNVGPSSFNQYLQPGQAVFVQNTSAGSPIMIITESHKAVGNAAAGVFRTTNTSDFGLLRVNLQANTNNQWDTIEGTLAVFNNMYSWNTTEEDAAKFANLDEEVSFVQNNTSLAIACQPNPSITDELPIRINNMRHSNYQWQFDLTNYDGATPYLFDAQNNTYTEIADGSIVPFMADVNTVNRFKVVFQNAALSNPEYGSTIVMYPNPAKRGSSFILQGVSSQSSVVMYNTLGQTIAVSTKENEAGLQVTPIALVSTGVYIVSITSEGKTSQVKWIVE